MKQIANRTMLLGRWDLSGAGYGRSISYRAACDCTSEDCDIHIDLEHDPDFDMMTMTFYKYVCFFDKWRDPKSVADKLRNILYRIKKAVELIFTGYLRMHEDFIFLGEDQVDSFISALQQGKDYVTKKRIMNRCLGCNHVLKNDEAKFCSAECINKFEDIDF